MSQDPISVLLLEPAIESVAALSAYLGKSAAVELMPVPDAREAEQASQQFLPCLLVVSLRGSLDGAVQLDMLAKLKKPIRSGQLKVLVVSSVKNHPLARAIAAAGITDYAEEPVTTKSLLFKTNLLLKAVATLKKKSNFDEPLVFKANEKSPVANDFKVGAGAKMKPALQLGEDTFVFKGAQPRKVGKGYLLEAEGPLPESGKWEPLPKEEGAEQKWRWAEIRAEGEEPQPAGDGWVMSGERPVFNAKKGKWQFSSRKPRLAYLKKSKEVAAKVETNEKGEIEIAEDSKVARENLLLNQTLATFLERERLIKESTDKIREDAEKRKRRGEIQKVKEGLGSRIVPEQAEEEDNSTRKSLLPTDHAEEKLRSNLPEIEEEDPASPRAKRQGLALVPEETAKGSPAPISMEKKEKNKLVPLPRSEELPKGARPAADLHHREKSLEGLKKEDLTGEQNLRDRMREGVTLNLAREKEAQEKKIEFQEEDKPLPNDRTGEETKSAEKKSTGKIRLVDLEESQVGVLLAEGIAPNELQAPRKKSARAVVDRAKAELQRLKEEAQREAARPLREALPAEEEKKLRRELEREEGVEPLAPRELDRLARLEKVKELKRRMEKIQRAAESGDESLAAMLPPELESVGELEAEEAARKERNFRAIESLEGTAEGFFEKKKAKAARAEKKELGPRSPSLPEAGDESSIGDLITGEFKKKKAKRNRLKPEAALAPLAAENFKEATFLPEPAPSDEKEEREEETSERGQASLGQELAPENAGEVISGAIGGAEGSGAVLAAEGAQALGKVEVEELAPTGLGAVIVEEAEVLAAAAENSDFALAAKDLLVLSAIVDAARVPASRLETWAKIAKVAQWAYPELNFTGGWPIESVGEPRLKFVLQRFAAAQEILT